jgi:hypothetical protein
MMGTVQTPRTAALDRLHDPKFVSDFLRRIEATGKRGRLRLSEASLGRIRDAVWCASEHSGRDPANIAAERLLSDIRAQIEPLVLMIKKLVGEQPPYPPFQKSCLPGCDDAPALMEILCRTDEAIAERKAYPRVRRALGVSDRRGRPPDRVILWLVYELARIYRGAGGEVTAGLKGPFAKFLEVVFEILPRHLQWGDKCWFASYAKRVPPRLRADCSSPPRPSPGSAKKGAHGA